MSASQRPSAFSHAGGSGGTGGRVKVNWIDGSARNAA
jgi:hypothetical protein